MELKTKIPAKEQRVIYKGKQLQLEHSLRYYSIEQDSSLHLLGRIQSTDGMAWRTVDDIMYAVSRMLRGDWFFSLNNIISDGPNSHPKVSSRVEDCLYTYIFPKDHVTTRCGTLIGSLEIWVGNGPMERTQAQHLGNTTAI